MFGCNNDRLFLVEYYKYGLSLCISLEKGDHYFIQTRHKNLFSFSFYLLCLFNLSYYKLNFENLSIVLGVVRGYRVILIIET